MDAHEPKSYFPAQQRSRALEWHSYTSTMYIDGSVFYRRSSPTETPISPPTSDARWLVKLEPNKTCRPPSTPRQTDSRSGRTNGWNNIYASLQTRSRKTGASGSQWHPQYIMTTVSHWLQSSC